MTVPVAVTTSPDNSERATDPYVLFPKPLVKKLPSLRVSPVFKAETVGLTDAATLGNSTLNLFSSSTSRRSFSPSSKIISPPPPLVPTSNSIPEPSSFIRNPLSCYPCTFSSCRNISPSETISISPIPSTSSVIEDSVAIYTGFVPSDSSNNMKSY